MNALRHVHVPSRQEVVVAVLATGVVCGEFTLVNTRIFPARQRNVRAVHWLDHSEALSMNRIVQLSVSGFVLTTLAYGCDASNTSVTELADAGAQGGSGATGGSGGARAGTGGTRASVGGALGTGGTRLNVGGTFGTGGAGATAGSANIAADCNLQGQLAAQLRCPGFTSQQAIVTACTQSETIPASCQAPLDTAITCLSQQPTSSFQCSANNDGSVSINPGVCTSQQNALVTCMAGGTVTGTCSDLTGCCAQLPVTDQTDCQQLVTTGIDANCGLALSAYQGLGLCI